MSISNIPYYYIFTSNQIYFYIITLYILITLITQSQQYTPVRYRLSKGFS